MTAMTDYKDDLDQRYWEYQRSHFSDCQEFFDRPYAPDGRPPVFRDASQNVIISPEAIVTERKTTVNLIKPNDRHRWFGSMNSSQALAQSVFGNLAIHNCLHYLTELQDDDGERLMGDAQVSSENFKMEFKVDNLGERRVTSLDVYFSGEYRVAVECKFTEAEVGSCSRPRLTEKNSNYARQHCDGVYSIKDGRNTRCPLTEIGVKYWQYVKDFFQWEKDTDLDPCPLNRNYQLVRNVLAIGVRPDGRVSLQDGHVIMIYDTRNPAFQQGGAALVAYLETKSKLVNPSMLRKCSWQRITHCLRQNGVLPWLTDQLALKYGL